MQYPRLFLAITFLGATPAAALHAQTGETRTQRERTVQLEAKIERLHREIETLVRRRLDAEQLRSRAAADSAARELEPQIARAARKLAELQTSLDRENVEQQIRGANAAAQAEWQAQWQATHAGYAMQWPSPAPTPSASGKGRQPSGWVGISFSGPTRTWYDSSKGLVMYHFDYPVILSVEPGSPAERAGLEAGDTVLAYDGLDVRKRQIMLGRQLRPGVRLVVRVRRDGGTRDVPVAVERRPASFAPSYTVVTPPEPMDPLPPRMRTRTPRPERVEVPADVGNVMIAPVAPTPLPALAPGAIAGVAPLAPPATVVVPSTITMLTGRPAVAGAEVMRMNAGFRDIFGVDGGVLVLNVAAGSPAAGSGLRAGDVILRVNGNTVATPLALQRAVQECSDRTARLEIVRKKKNERLTLRW